MSNYKSEYYSNNKAKKIGYIIGILLFIIGASVYTFTRFILCSEYISDKNVCILYSFFNIL